MPVIASLVEDKSAPPYPSIYKNYINWICKFVYEKLNPIDIYLYMNKMIITQFSKDEIQSIANRSNTWYSFMNNLGYKKSNGLSRTLVKKWVVENGIIFNPSRTTSQPLSKEEAIVKYFTNKPLFGNPKGRVKFYIKKYNLLEEKCNICGQGTMWNNLPLTLELDHINGEPTDNRLENLRILCPNCHQQQPTTNRVRKGRKPTDDVVMKIFKDKNPKNVRQLLNFIGIADCKPNYDWVYSVLYRNGVETWNEVYERNISILKLKLAEKKKRYIHPSKEELIGLVEKYPLLEIAKNYNVSSVAVAKLCKKYNIPTKPRGYWAKVRSKNLSPRNGTGYEPDCA